MTNAPDRILVADDHAVLRAGVKTMVQALLPRAEFVETDTWPATRAAAAQGPWRLITLDLGMPEGDGPEQVRSVHAACPGAAILVYTMFDEERVGLGVARAGADGFISKSASRAEFGAALARLLAGETHYSYTLRSQLHAARARRPRTGRAALSAREQEVLKLFGAGQTQKEIAARLGMSVSSVGTYRKRILQKLGLRTTSELLSYLAMRWRG